MGEPPTAALKKWPVNTIRMIRSERWCGSDFRAPRPTRFVETHGIRFAYRRFGNKVGVPLVFNPHILGNMDSWDPSVTDGLAKTREIILFDNAGVAGSTGEVPQTFAGMAKNAGTFIDALGLAQVDILGFSIGSMVAQMIAHDRADIVRKLVIVGSGPRNGDSIPLTPESQLIFTNKYGNADDFWIDGFFTASPASQAAGRAFLKRRDARVTDRDVAISDKVQPAQFAALQEWATPVGECFAYLQDIQMPVLVVGGKADIIFGFSPRLALSISGAVRGTHKSVPSRLSA